MSHSLAGRTRDQVIAILLAIVAVVTAMLVLLVLVTKADGLGARPGC